MNKVALITGAARRIGAEIARTLHHTGMNVVLHYYASEQEARDLCTQLNNIRSDSAVTVRCNLNEISLLSRLVEEAAGTWGRLDVLVNNASRFYRTPIGQPTENAWQDLLVSNLQAPFFLSQTAAKFLSAQNGCIINIADVHGHQAMRNYSIYCISKAGLLMMTKTLAKELAPNIRVNSVSPGTVDWPEGANALDDATKEKIIEKTALKHLGSPKDIAQAVLFLIKDADYITGEEIIVDGGSLVQKT